MGCISIGRESKKGVRVGKEERREDNSRMRTQLEQRLRSQGAHRAFLRLGVGGKEAVAIVGKGALSCP